MSLEATVAQLAEEEVDDGEFDITIDPTVLQDDFYRDHEVESCSSGEEEGLDDDPSCDYVEDLSDKSDLKVLREPQARVAYAQNGSLGLFHLFLTKSWLMVKSEVVSKGEEKNFPRAIHGLHWT
jgi:hypothetical protein